MSVNVFASQIAASSAVSFSESAGSPPQRVQAPTATGARKNFATVLHTVDRLKETGPSHKSSDRQPLDTSDREGRAERTKPPKARVSQHQESESRPGKTEDRSRHDQDDRESDDAPQTDRESLELRDQVHPHSPDDPRALIETPIPIPSMGQSDVVEPDPDEDSLLSALEQNETAGRDSTPPGLSVVIAAGLQSSHALSLDRPIPVDGPNRMTDQEGLPESLRAIAADMMADIPEADGHTPPSVRDGADQGAHKHPGASPSGPSPTGLPVASQEAGLQKLQGSPVAPILENASAPVQKDALETKPLSVMANDRHPVAGDTRQSDMDWSEQGSREHAGNESPLPHQMAAVPAPANSASAAVGDAGTFGAAALSLSRPTESSSASVVPPPISAPRDADEPSLPATARSVVFEVAQPDLGRVHVRVAMANEMVHAYLSSDRAEVGQFLINGQDRLQTALQANGLELGQFRVDIDRQQTGRSFQQGQPHEQSREWNHGSSQREGDRAAEPHDSRRSWSQGRLNLVA